jgi:hypothetical protein
MKNINLFTASLPSTQVSPKDELTNKGIQIIKKTSGYISIERMTAPSITHHHEQPDMTVNLLFPSHFSLRL